MKNVALVFPGQGSQVVGMAVDFAEDAACREVAGVVDEALKLNLFKMMREGPLEDLTATEVAQPALLLAGMMAIIYLKKQTKKSLGELAGWVAGHSLGEYTAVCAAGGLDVAVAARLVRLRGEAMRDAGQRQGAAGGGGMAAILGMEAATARQVAATSGVTLANDNAPGQVIFSGTLEALAKAEEAAKAAGAKRCLRLNVGGAFHTPMMAGAAEAVRGFLGEHPVRDLAVPCVMNHSAAPEQGAHAVAEGLVAQVTGQVRWRESMEFLAVAGVEQVVELGVGRVLGGLAGRCDARLRGVSLSSRAEVDGWLEEGMSG